MERGQLRRVIPLAGLFIFEEGVVALDVLAGQFIDQMPHPNVSLAHLPEQVGVAGLFEEKHKGKGQRKVAQAINAQPHAIVNGSAEDEEGHRMQVSFFVDEDIGILDGCAFILGLVEIPQQKVASGLVFLRVELVILEQSGDERPFADEQVPKQAIERILLGPVLVGSYLLNDLLEFLPVVVPKRQGEVPHPIPVYYGLVVFEFGQSFFFVERVREQDYLHGVERPRAEWRLEKQHYVLGEVVHAFGVGEHCGQGGKDGLEDQRILLFQLNLVAALQDFLGKLFEKGLLLLQAMLREQAEAVLLRFIAAAQELDTESMVKLANEFSGLEPLVNSMQGLEEQLEAVALYQRQQQPGMMRRINLPQIELLGQQSFRQRERVIDHVLVDSRSYPSYRVANPKGKSAWLYQLDGVGLRTKAAKEKGVQPLENDDVVALLVLHQLQEECVIFDNDDEAAPVNRRYGVIEDLVLAVQDLQQSVDGKDSEQFIAASYFYLLLPFLRPVTTRQGTAGSAAGFESADCDFLVVDSIGEKEILFANPIQERFGEGICLYDNCFLVPQSESRGNNSFWAKPIEPDASYEVKYLIRVANILHSISRGILESHSIRTDTLPPCENSLLVQTQHGVLRQEKSLLAVHLIKHRQIALIAEAEQLPSASVPRQHCVLQAGNRVDVSSQQVFVGQLVFYLESGGKKEAEEGVVLRLANQCQFAVLAPGCEHPPHVDVLIVQPQLAQLPQL